MLRKIPLALSAVVFVPGTGNADPFRTTIRQFAGFQECTKALWDSLQLLGGDKGLVQWNRNAPSTGSLELVDDSGKRILVRARCEEVQDTGPGRGRFRGFVEFP